MLSLKGVSVLIESRVSQSFKYNLGNNHDAAVGGNIVSTSRGIKRVKAIDNLTLEIKKGDRIGLIGHNGSGKSTLLKLISGIYRPTNGAIEGELFEPLLSRAFLVSEELAGIDAIKAHYLVHGRRRKQMSLGECIDIISTQSGLGEFLKLPIRTYSRGMAERLMFCMTTLFSYCALAIDEGFGTADAAFQGYAEKRLAAYLEKTDSLVIASHSEAMLRAFCNKGVVMGSGRVVYTGCLSKCLDYYASQYIHR